MAVSAGCVQNLVEFAPADPANPLDVAGTQHADYLYNQAVATAVTTGFFDANLDGDTADPGEYRPDLAGRSDWIGVNYYLRAGVVENGQWSPTEQGVPQGGPLTPRTQWITSSV